MRRELATDRGAERDGCNKRFSLVKLGGFAEATGISREFNVTGMLKKAIFVKILRSKVMA